MRGCMLSVMAALGFVLGSALAASAAVPAGEKLNVLMIAVDDLRPQIGCYGDTMARTPNLDRLASRGVLFNRAYCQQAVCSPSRTSLMTGRRPDTTKVYDLKTHFRTHIPDVVTLSQCFKNAGYHAQAMGKIYHGGFDDPPSWSVPAWFPKNKNYGDPELLRKLDEAKRVKGPAWESPDVADNALRDGETADKAIEVLREVKDKPFFLAVGFYKPHLPFVAPKKYFDLFPPDRIRLPDNPSPPKDAPELALTDWGELRGYMGIPQTGPLSDETTRQLIRAYYASVSYTDAQIGKVLSELDRLGLAGRTIVAVWGDHGWQLGEHGLWCKHTNFELAARAPLVVAAPGSSAAKTDALVEFVDLYPTLCELAGIPLPDGLEGTSLVPLMAKPEGPWKKAVFNQYPRGKVMGYSMRTDRYRFTRWAEPGKAPVGVELYDHVKDPAENVNIAGLPENAALVKELEAALEAGWRQAVPRSE